MTTKMCSTCKEEKPLDSFSMNRGKRRSNCKDCSRRSKAEWYQRNRGITGLRRNEHRNRLRKIVIDAKSIPCMDCGGVFHHSLMDFDHRDSETKIAGLSELTAGGRPFAMVRAEIDKCDAVCCMCHRVRTWNRLHPEETITRECVGDGEPSLAVTQVSKR